MENLLDVLRSPYDHSRDLAEFNLPALDRLDRCDVVTYILRMPAITLSVRDSGIWDRARRVAGPQGLSALVEQALRAQLVTPVTTDQDQAFSLAVSSEEQPEELRQTLEFTGRLLVDSETFSIGQLPRIRVYRTAKGRLVVYRTWPVGFQMEPTYSVFEDLDALESDSQALATMWITSTDSSDELRDLTPEFSRALRRVLRTTAISVDDLEPTQLAGKRTQEVRLPADAGLVRAGLTGRRDQDVLLVAMYLLGATGESALHLADIESAFRALKPVSRMGNRPEDLKDIQANMRGYLNNDKRKRQPAQRLFVNTGRGFWALSAVGERRALDVLRLVGFSRAA